jgi:membrane fusion protein
MSEGLYRQEVIDEKSHRLDGAVSLLQPPMFKVLTLLILILLITSIVFLSIGSYTNKERVIGVLQPDMGILKLGSPQSGIITEIFVTEGQPVKKGQPILRIQSEKYGIDGIGVNQSLIKQYNIQLVKLNKKSSQQIIQHKLQIDRLKIARENLKLQLVQMELQYEIYKERIELNNEIVQQSHTLAGSGYISDLELNRQYDTLLSIKHQSSAILSQKISIRNEIEGIDNQLVQVVIEQYQVIDEVEKQAGEIEAQLVSLKQKNLGELRSPMDGIITGLLVKAGQKVISNDNLLSLVPSDSQLQAVLYVPTSAFGFIEKGQQIRLRYHAFAYQKFGVYGGSILEVSENVIFPSETSIPDIITKPSYRVIVKLEQNNITAYGRKIPLRSGMMLDADIILENRSLLRWVFDPVYSVKGSL